MYHPHPNVAPLNAALFWSLAAFAGNNKLGPDNNGQASVYEGIICAYIYIAIDTKGYRGNVVVDVSKQSV